MSDQNPLVIFMPSGRRGQVPTGTPLLEAARELGVGIESICSGRLTCGKCKVRVEEGQFAKHGVTSAADHLTPVGSDEREAGLRAILNFGHTFGHAIEAGMGYGQWLHGEGVGAGMVMAAHLSQRLGLVDAAFVQRLTTLIARAGLPVRGAILDAQDNAGRYLELMRVDKKAEAGEIRFVLIDGPGQACVRAAPDALVREVIDACCAP